MIRLYPKNDLKTDLRIDLKIGQKITPYQAMRYAIRLALRGFPETKDNPAVGCVIVDKDHCFLAAGYHKRSGSDHAEIAALKNLDGSQQFVGSVNDVADLKLRGARVYVTLEPCAFDGRTGSCAKVIAKLPVESVVVGCVDPHEKVQGSGIELLRESGKNVFLFSELSEDERGGGDLQEPLSRLIEVFECNQLQKKAFVSLKVATSLDGQMAFSNGDSRWISGESSRQYVHRLRYRYHGILIGIDTFLYDNPKLNIREFKQPEAPQKVFVLDRQLRGAGKIDGSDLVKIHAKENLYWVVGDSLAGQQGLANKVAKVEKHAQVLRCPLIGNELDLQFLKKKMLELGAYSVLVEGGAKTHSIFLKQGAADRIFQFIAPIIIGDRAAKTWTEQFSIKDLNQRLHLKLPITRRFGKDILVTGRI